MTRPETTKPTDAPYAATSPSSAGMNGAAPAPKPAVTRPTARPRWSGYQRNATPTLPA